MCKLGSVTGWLWGLNDTTVVKHLARSDGSGNARSSAAVSHSVGVSCSQGFLRRSLTVKSRYSQRVGRTSASTPLVVEETEAPGDLNYLLKVIHPIRGGNRQVPDFRRFVSTCNGPGPPVRREKAKSGTIWLGVAWCGLVQPGLFAPRDPATWKIWANASCRWRPPRRAGPAWREGWNFCLPIPVLNSNCFLGCSCPSKVR